MAESPYSFVPAASDDDGDQLVFAIENKPAWASFDPASGALTGTPTVGDAGTYTAIAISVSDGAASAALEPYAITVTQSGNGSATLSWDAPTASSDGSGLTDLAGYRVHYGAASGVYTSEIAIDNPGVGAYVVENLGSGTYYFVVTAIDTAGNESTLSNEVSKTIP